MATPFDLWDLQDARAVVQLDKERTTEITSYTAFVQGDHWQDWAGWVGPIPDPTDQDAARVKQDIERGFVSRNAIGECVGRHVNGVLGRDVKWSLMPRRELQDDEQPTTQEQALIDEAKGLLKEWIEARELNQKYDELIETLLTTGEAYQRPFVPSGELDGGGAIPVADLATSLGRVHVHFPLSGEAKIHTDPRTQQKCSIYFYREVTESRPSQVGQGQGQERAELTYLDGDKTVVRIVGDDERREEYDFALSGRLLLSAMKRKPLVNPQVVSQQKSLNLALTMKERNIILAGYLERVAINAQMNGTFEEDSNGAKRFVPSALPVGAGSMLSLTGYVTHDKEGGETLVTPNMLWRDPVDVKTFLDTENSAYRHILAECNQLHYGAASDSGISAESRMVSMAAYTIDLLQTKQQADKGWAWLLETALALAAVLSGQPGRYDGLRVSAECSVDAGPISTEMIHASMSLAGNQQLLSVKTAQEWIGIENTDAEQAQIAKEQEEAVQAFDVAGVQQILERVRGGATA